MATTYSREAIQAEADFNAHFFGLTTDEALAHEAVRIHFLQRQSHRHNFDCDATRDWLHQYLPKSMDDRQRVGREMKDLQGKIHADDASYNHYCYAYTQFRKHYHYA